MSCVEAHAAEPHVVPFGSLPPSPSQRRIPKGSQRRLAFVLGGLLLGCGGASAPPLSLVPDEDLSEARQAAPDLVVEVDRAEELALAAQREGDDEAAEDYATLSRLFAEAALLETERQQLEGQVLGLQERLEQTAGEAAALEAQRAELDAQLGRRRAAALARQEARAAFERAERDEERRVRRRSGENAIMHRRAALTLLRRARILAAAAGALGANENAVLLVQDEALQAERQGDPTEALRAASAIHRRALELLGQARSAHPVSSSATQALLEMATERGVEAEVSEGGVLLQGELQNGRRFNTGRVRALADLLLAHPHGPVVLQGSQRTTQSLLRQLGGVGVARERLQAGEGEGLSVLLPAYGESSAP